MIHYCPYEGKSLLTLLLDNIILRKDAGHLWFLPTLFAITILYYTILYYIPRTYIRKIPGWSVLIGLFAVSMVSIKVPNILYMKSIAEYTLFFYLGYFVREYLTTKQTKELSIIFGTVMFFLQFTEIIISKCLDYHNMMVSFVLQRTSSVCSVLFFYFLFTKIDNILPNIYRSKIISFIDKESSPIYLFHSPLMYVVLFLGANKMTNPFISVSINFIICLFGSLGISQIIQRTKKLNFIIGK